MRITRTIFAIWGFLTVMVAAFAGDPISYSSRSYTDGGTRFSRKSKICISLTPGTPAVHEDDFARVVEIARREGLTCVPKAEAEFELLVSFRGTPAQNRPAGFRKMSIEGLAFPLSGQGETRSEFSVWEGFAGGWRTFGPKDDPNPPLVDTGKVAEEFVRQIGRGSAYVTQPMAGEIGGKTPGSGPKVPAEGLPTECVKAAPRTEDFNRIARLLFDNDPIDFREQSFKPATLRSLQGQTANQVFRKLKLREKEFGGAVKIVAMPSEGENTIIVKLRIVQQSGGKKTLYERYLHINFSKGNMLLSVDRGMYSRLEVE